MKFNGKVWTMPRTYERTHPWLSFSLNTGRFGPELWIALGEAASKAQHVAGVPLAPVVAEQMHQLYLVKGAVATTAIEGNTLSEEEAEKIITGKLKLPPTQKYLAQELTNITDAFNALTERLAQDSGAAVTVDLLADMNRMVLKDLEVEEGVIPGAIRQHNVVVGRYRCAPAEDCRFLLDKFCEMLASFPEPKEFKKEFCIIKAAFAHLYLVWIHPFGDGNGRTARLLELYILLRAGFPQPTGHLLSNHYNKTRSKYYQMLDAAVNGNEHVVAFISYSVQGFLDGLREQVRSIRLHQWEIAWINFIYSTFHNHDSPADRRRRTLILALSTVRTAQISKLQDLSTELAREYAGKTARTVARDVNELIRMGLAERVRGGSIRARREKILAFLPWNADANWDDLVGADVVSDEP